MNRHLSIPLFLLLPGAAALAAEAPLEIQTKTLRATFTKGALSSLSDAAGRVYAQPSGELRALGIHRIDARTECDIQGFVIVGEPDPRLFLIRQEEPVPCEREPLLQTRKPRNHGG